MMTTFFNAFHVSVFSADIWLSKLSVLNDFFQTIVTFFLNITSKKSIGNIRHLS